MARQAAAEQVLIGGRHHAFACTRSKGRYAVGVSGIEEPRSLEVGDGVKVGLLVSLGAEGKAPRPVAGLERLVRHDLLYSPVRELSSTHAVIEARRKLEAEVESDVAASLSRRAEDPRLSADNDVPNARDIVDSIRRILLIPGSLQDGNVDIGRPARCELSLDSDVVQVLMVLDLVA